MEEVTGFAPFGDQDLLFCWQCHVSSRLTYRGSIDSQVLFIDWAAQGRKDDYPLWDKYPEHFPLNVLHFRKQALSERAILLRAHASGQYLGIDRTDLSYEEKSSLFKPAYFIGGVPFLLHRPKVVSCPYCFREMKLLATVPNENGTSTGFCDNEYLVMVYLYCLNCFCVTASHQTD